MRVIDRYYIVNPEPIQNRRTKLYLCRKALIPITSEVIRKDTLCQWLVHNTILVTTIPTERSEQRGMDD
mgnify:CR=1 FL=1